MDQGPDWFGFWGQAVAAGIGALAAFIFALWQGQLFNQRERRARQLEEREAYLLVLKGAIDASGLNLEELVNFKSQTLISLAAEAEALAATLQQAAVPEIIAVAETLPNFFQELPIGRFATIPPSDKFAFAIDYAPAITKFVHRAASVPEQLNDAIKTRNEITRAWANVARGGPTENDIRYFFTMMVSSARNIASHANDALFFQLLLHDQCYLIGIEKFERPVFRSVRFPKEKVALLMPDDYVKGYRNQLQTFGRKLPPRTESEAPPSS